MSIIEFSDWELDEFISSAISRLGWKNPTEIQTEAVPAGIRGFDIIGQARTGSGKTAAFGIPILETCSPSNGLQSLILCPTRELAIQVSEEIENLQGSKGIDICAIYGGTDIEKQAKQLQKGVDIIVGTPGRVIDMSKRGHIDLGMASIFCLDEADRMMDMGFLPDITWILGKMENRKQTLLFSATFPQEILDISEEFTNNPVFIMSNELEIEIPEIDQYAIRVGRINKMWALSRIITNMDSDDQILIFVNTKRMVEMISQRLNREGFEVSSLHGDLTQNKREKIISNYKSGESKILVATDVAARGLDIDGVTTVVNYDLPDDFENYVHRIGRTGRMGRHGVAWNFVSKNEKEKLNRIASTWNLKIPYTNPPEIKDGKRDKIRKRDDWEEESNSFGMVRIEIAITSSEISKYNLFEWILRECKIPDIAIGDIIIGKNSSFIEIHIKKAGFVLDILKNRKLKGKKLKPMVIS
tara:strand:+ start:1087 stop:2499 length:1413 start_codon:yes stop_codon:yes gene_type:complete